MLPINGKLGTQLSPADQRHVLSAYVHRFTAEHKPAWANKPMPNGGRCPVQYASDQEWLANTRFAVTKCGKLDMRSRYCYARPTWPNNPELR